MCVLRVIIVWTLITMCVDSNTGSTSDSRNEQECMHYMGITCTFLKLLIVMFMV